MVRLSPPLKAIPPNSVRGYGQSLTYRAKLIRHLNKQDGKNSAAEKNPFWRNQSRQDYSVAIMNAVPQLDHVSCAVFSFQAARA